MIAIIAGTGTLPLTACKRLLDDKKDFFVLSLFEDNYLALVETCNHVAPVFPCEVFKFGQVIKLLEEQKTTHALLIGKVDKTNLLKKFKFDWLAIQYLGSLLTNSDKSLMDKAVQILESHNIKVLNQLDVLANLCAETGVLTGVLTPELEENIAYGMEIAIKISECDIGQTVVVKNKMIVAIEALEGTDECIKRATELVGNGLIICKAIRPKHSTQYDLPTLGTKTLTGIKSKQIAAIAWQADKTFIADLVPFIKKAKELEILLQAR